MLWLFHTTDDARYATVVLRWSCKGHTLLTYIFKLSELKSCSNILSPDIGLVPKKTFSRHVPINNYYIRMIQETECGPLKLFVWFISLAPEKILYVWKLSMAVPCTEDNVIKEEWTWCWKSRQRETEQEADVKFLVTGMSSGYRHVFSRYLRSFPSLPSISLPIHPSLPPVFLSSSLCRVRAKAHSSVPYQRISSVTSSLPALPPFPSLSLSSQNTVAFWVVKWGVITHRERDREREVEQESVEREMWVC